MIDFEKVFNESYKRVLSGTTSRENDFFDAFYEAFDVQPGDALWLDEDKRVTIW